MGGIRDRSVLAGGCAVGVLGMLAGLFWFQENRKEPAPPVVTTDFADEVIVTRHDDTIPVCPACSVRLRPIASIGSAEDPELIRDVRKIRIERDKQGRFYVTVRDALEHPLIVYEADGDYLRSIGRTGEGPGEFRYGITDIFVGPGDTLYVAHDGMVSLFNPIGDFARSFKPQPLGSMSRFAGSWERGLVMNTEYHRADLADIPFHLHDRNGQHIGAFGTPALLSDVAERMVIPTRRAVAMATDGSFWVAEPAVYRIEHIDLRGKVRHVIAVSLPSDWHLNAWATKREAEEWWEETAETRDPGNTPRGAVISLGNRPSRLPAPPTVLIESMAMISDSVLAVAIHVPSEDWQDVHIVYNSQDRQHALFAADVFQRIYDTVLDLIDVNSGSLLTRERIEGRAFLTRDGTLVNPRMDEAGVISIQASTIEFVRSGAPD